MTTEKTTQEQSRTSEVFQRLFDDLYHMGRPDEIFATAPEILAPKRRIAATRRQRRSGPVSQQTRRSA